MIGTTSRKVEMFLRRNLSWEGQREVRRKGFKWQSDADESERTGVKGKRSKQSFFSNMNFLTG